MKRMWLRDWFRQESRTSRLHGRRSRRERTYFRPQFNTLEDRCLPSGVFQEFGAFPTGGSPFAITAGPDGNLWFTQYFGNKIGRITPAGDVIEFIPAVNQVYNITAGPDGNLWLTADSQRLVRLTPDGKSTTFTVDGQPSAITAGPDGNLWLGVYVDENPNHSRIERITPDGQVDAEFELPPESSGRTIDGITTGPDGNLWFSLYQPFTHVSLIDRITPDGQVTEFVLPADPFPEVAPLDLVANEADGNVWFVANYGAIGKVGRITPDGDITVYPLPTSGYYSGSLTATPDGNVWYTHYEAHNLGQVTPDGTITECQIPAFNAGPEGIIADADGNLWFDDVVRGSIWELMPDSVPGAAGNGGGPGTAIVGTTLHFLSRNPTGFSWRETVSIGFVSWTAMPERRTDHVQAAAGSEVHAPSRVEVVAHPLLTRPTDGSSLSWSLFAFAIELELQLV